MCRILSILFSLFFCLPCKADTEVPKVYHFDEKTYQSLSQNWDIFQGANGLMYFGNSGGLLSYDGHRWRSRIIPYSKIVRAVHADAEGRVFVGGFASMGYWQVNEKWEEEYVSLAGQLGEAQIADEEIWHILPLPDGILFQSFSNIYKYNYKKIEAIDPPGNIMFCQNIHGRTIVPVIDKGLYELHQDGTFSFLSGSEIFAGKRVATILPMEGGGFLVGLQNDGIYTFRNGSFSKWKAPVSAVLEPLQLNKGLRLRSGNYVFGSILGGLFITDSEGQILHQINQENGLQNNTVLALFEDDMNMLWVGLDKGVDLVDLNSPLLFYPDKSGLIGTVYTAAIFEGHLYIGSNQGVFRKPFPSENKNFELLPGSQGQVWELRVFDGQLLGGHNSGIIKIKDGHLEFLNQEAGAFTFAEHPDDADLLLQGSYIGINVLRRNKAGFWEYSHRINGHGSPVRQLFFDAEKMLWARHNRRGVVRLKIDSAAERVLAKQEIDASFGIPSEFEVSIGKVGEDIIVKSNGELFIWDMGNQVLRAIDGYESLHSIDDGSQFPYLVYPDQIHWGEGDERHVFHLDLPESNGCVVPLSAEYCFLCVEQGYALLPILKSTAPPHQSHRLHLPLLTQITVNENGAGMRHLFSPPDSLNFQSSERHLRFYFSIPKYGTVPLLRTRLLGFDRDWTAFSPASDREFTNLPPGEYQFQIQAENLPGTKVFTFTIEPRWFQTKWASLLFFTLFAGLFALLFRLHGRRLKKQAEILRKENAKELRRQQIEGENQMLQAAVENKSRKLADTTMNLVRKNETLMKINEELTFAKKEKDAAQIKKQLSRLTRMVEGHLSSEEDWKAFEENFNQIHDQFFKRLKEQFTELTPGDFRLAAYLKMNLSSKEIAPLLNISLRGVENKRYRLRKKLGLGAEDNLTEFFMQF